MNFIYVLIGWEGSAADARVLRDAFTRDDSVKVPRGEHAETFISTLQDVLNMDYKVANDTAGGGNYISNGVEGDGESMSATHTLSFKPSIGATSNSKKRKHVNKGDDAIVEAINNLAAITKDTMKDSIKELATEEKISNAQEKQHDETNLFSQSGRDGSKSQIAGKSQFMP
ncbi:hypothetical protein ZIOFF_054512 [Zingiber officinale]|uniref:Uncharacterized protein n=1 Tax=Zingiber officinale TaxID=94328 RepID=A0A8J5KR76_ZINOF|nr:hypothetical protein ZIOFF_054512 [Zingiber officinale]